jgi:hypothetical protein
MRNNWNIIIRELLLHTIPVFVCFNAGLHEWYGETIVQQVQGLRESSFWTSSPVMCLCADLREIVLGERWHFIKFYARHIQKNYLKFSLLCKSMRTVWNLSGLPERVFVFHKILGSVCEAFHRFTNFSCIFCCFRGLEIALCVSFNGICQNAALLQKS